MSNRIIFMKHKLIITITLVAALLAPMFVIQAQDRAQEILNQQQQRQQDLADRNAERLADIDDRFQEAYEDRIIPQIDNVGADIRAGLIPVTYVIDNISVKLSDIMTILEDNNIPLDAVTTAPNAWATYDITDKYNNFLECYNDSDPETPTTYLCDVYEVPASGSLEDVPSVNAGIQPIIPTGAPVYETGPFTYWLEILSPANGDFTSAGAGYATGQRKVFGSGVSEEMLIPFAYQPPYAVTLDYTELRENGIRMWLWGNDPDRISPPSKTWGDVFPVNVGLTQFEVDSAGAWVGDIADPSDNRPDAGIVCDDPATIGVVENCEFTDPKVFEVAVAMQVAKLRSDLNNTRTSLNYVQQAIQAFVFDVDQALENYRRSLGSYDPRDGF